MKRTIGLIVAVLMVLALAAPAAASEHQQDGYHHYGTNAANSYWVDDACGDAQAQEFVAYFYVNGMGDKPYTKVCHTEFAFNADDGVPYGLPYQNPAPCTQCGWQHLSMNDRTSNIRITYMPSGFCMWVYKDSTSGGAYVRFLRNSAHPQAEGDYTSPDDFPNDWISRVERNPC